MKNILGMGNDEMSEVCCIQSTSAHEDRDEERWKAADKSNHHPVSHSFRLIYPEGAVLKDVIKIDLCPSIGGLEMGKVIGTSDCCTNRIRYNVISY